MNHRQRASTWILLLMTTMYMLFVPTPAATGDHSEDYQVRMAKASELRCLATNVYHEARAEPVAGQYAVAMVTVNRAKQAGKSVCQVVSEKKMVSGKPICQFSWYCDKRKRGVKLDADGMFQSLHIADQVMGGNVSNKLKRTMRHATHFHNDAVTPNWSTKLNYIGKLGNHHFYGSRQQRV